MIKSLHSCRHSNDKSRAIGFSSLRVQKTFFQGRAKKAFGMSFLGDRKYIAEKNSCPALFALNSTNKDISTAYFRKSSLSTAAATWFSSRSVTSPYGEGIHSSSFALSVLTFSCSRVLCKTFFRRSHQIRSLTHETASTKIPFQVSRVCFNLPELLEIQRASFNSFIQFGIPDLLSQIAPIRVTQDETTVELTLNGKNYQLITPDESPRDCILKMKTYSCKLYVEAKLVYKNISGQTLYSTRGEWVLIGHLPLMTKRGHFIVNGSPRVVVHQVVRSPGIYFQQVLEKREKKRITYFGDIIPRKGVWLRLQITQKGKIEAKLKNGKKISADMLERCLQFLERYTLNSLSGSAEKRLIGGNALMESFDSFFFDLQKEKQTTKRAQVALNQSANSTTTLVLGKLAPVRLNELSAPRRYKIARAVSPEISPPCNVFDGEFSIQGSHIINFASLPEEKALLHTYDKLYRPSEDKDREKSSQKIRRDSSTNNLLADKQYKLERCSQNLFDTFKDVNRYDLSDLGREKINTKFGSFVLEKQLTSLDLSNTSSWLHKLTRGECSVDDIDHLQNRRIRTSGELLYTQFESGIDRLKRLVWKKLKENLHLKSTNLGGLERSYQSGIKLSPSTSLSLRKPNKKSNAGVPKGSSSARPFLRRRQELEIDNKKDGISTRTLFDAKPQSMSSFYSSGPHIFSSFSAPSAEKELALISLKELFSTKPLNGALRELFGSNPLSQYMDQTNPLAEITHKRRTSCLGIGGVSRESAGMVIRGIHPTHYGRICPIETPEGKNAGLVNSLALYAKTNAKGFLETPYYKVVKGQVQHELGFTYFSAERESASHLNIAPSDLKQSWNNMISKDSVPVRVSDNLLDVFKKTDSYQVNCVGISPVQMISIATSLIPFLEHNDANRALMGSNMQRQAVPLMIPERAIVGTGFESLVVAESGHLVQSELTGFVSYVSADRIRVESLACSPKVTDNTDRLENGAFSLPLLPFMPYLSKKAITPLKLTSQLPRLQKLNTVQSNSVKSFLKLQKDQKNQVLPICPKETSFSNLRFKQAINDERPSFSFLQYSHILREWIEKDQAKKVSWIPLSQRNSPLQDFVDMRKFGGICDMIFCLDKAKNYTYTEVEKINGFVRRDFGSNHKLRLQATLFQDIVRHSLSPQRSSIGDLFKQAHLKEIARSTTCFQSLWFNSLLNKIAHEYTSFTHGITNFDRSNQETCLTQRALVQEGDWVQRGDILTDCSSSDQGEFAVGKNVLVAYIPWEGYNFEDAIVISERLVKEDLYTSLHIERYDFNAQDVEDGVEWFTNQLPGIPNQEVAHLDEFGLPKIGTFVKEGDILVGKMRHSTKSPITPYQRLVGDILDETNFAAQDYSFYVPKGVEARVIKHQIVKFFENPSRLLSETRHSPQLVHIFLGEKRGIQVGDKMSGRHGNKGVVSTILPRQDMPYLPDGTPIDIILNPLGVPSRMNVGQVYECLLGLAGTYLEQHFKIMPFDELYGVEASKSVVYLKLYQARLQSGQAWLFQVDFPGKTRLVDGRSGECFEQWITVGKAYMLKLIHMVNEKIHARATGPYALVTQQPLRGRSQKGGQRLGEMEVWALEGFGAAYTLQELLTKKSDDMVGRKEISASILPRPVSILDVIQTPTQTKNKKSTIGQSEIFKVLICELQALCLDLGVYSLTDESFQRSFRSRVD